MKAFGFWFYEELLPIIELNKKEKVVLATPNYGDIAVNVGSSRLTCLKRNPVCVHCHKRGAIWILESHTDEAPHLNLYAPSKPDGSWKKINGEELLLMTQDHIIPKSKGGGNEQRNLQTMCTLCNAKKADKMPPNWKKRAERRREMFADIKMVQV